MNLGLVAIRLLTLVLSLLCFKFLELLYEISITLLEKLDFFGLSGVGLSFGELLSHLFDLSVLFGTDLLKVCDLLIFPCLFGAELLQVVASAGRLQLQRGVGYLQLSDLLLLSLHRLLLLLQFLSQLLLLGE